MNQCFVLISKKILYILFNCYYSVSGLELAVWYQARYRTWKQLSAFEIITGNSSDMSWNKQTLCSNRGAVSTQHPEWNSAKKRNPKQYKVHHYHTNHPKLAHKNGNFKAVTSTVWAAGSGRKQGYCSCQLGWNPLWWGVEYAGRTREGVGANAILTFKLTRKLSNITASTPAHQPRK